MRASKAAGTGVKHCITTIWCDEGNEADVWSCLPGLQYFAEHAYTKADEVDVALVKLKFGKSWLASHFSKLCSTWFMQMVSLAVASTPS